MLRYGCSDQLSTPTGAHDGEIAASFTDRFGRTSLSCSPPVMWVVNVAEAPRRVPWAAIELAMAQFGTTTRCIPTRAWEMMPPQG